MKSPSLMLRAIALPLFTLSLSGILVTKQYARRDRLTRELKESQAEYTRLAKEMPSIPASSAALFSESKEHTHSEAEEEAHHHEASHAEGAEQIDARSSALLTRETPQGSAHSTLPATKLPR